jgi:F-type H+-transporting ATPase subunit gamma
MANTTALKRRIGSIKNTKQITKAMELVAASKMRRAQDQAVASRPYRVAAGEILQRLSGVSDVRLHPLFAKRKIKNTLIVVTTSDRGLAGAYNSNILKLLTKTIKENQDKNIHTSVIAVGRKASQFVSRLSGVEMSGAYPMLGDKPDAVELRPIINFITDKYKNEEIDAVSVLYTHFISNLTQEAKVLELLPTVLADDKKVSELEVAIFEPSTDVVVGHVLERLIEVQLWQVLLESLASEHSMRMLAMKNATDNASDIIDDLTLEFNTARQAAITQEIAEIVGGAEAVSI